jgi:hypothetical protein
MRKHFALFAAAAALFALSSFGSQAMPVSPLKSLTSSDQTITQVRDGCGRGWHRGRHGHCRRNR